MAIPADLKVIAITKVPVIRLACAGTKLAMKLRWCVSVPSSSLGSTARSINALVRKSNILTAANQRTTHMNVDEFCAYAEELLDRLFRLEQQIVQNTKRDFWRSDEDLTIISRALTLEKRAKELDGEFNLRRTGIHFTYPSASGHFALNDKGISACAKIILCCEKDELQRQEQSHKLVDSGECDSYKTAEQRVCQATDEDNFQNLSKRSPLLPSEKESSWPKKSSR